MSRWNSALAIAAVAGLGACTTLGPNFASPPAPAVAGYVAPGEAATPIAQLAPETRAAGPWWQALGSPQLDQVMTEALAGNRTVAVAEANLQKAQYQTASVSGSLKPQVDANAGAQRNRINTAVFGFSDIPSPTINLFTVGANVVYDLDVFGGGRRRLEAARAHTEGEAARADAAYLTLTGNVALQAVRIAGLRAQIDAVEAMIADDAKNIDIANRAEAAGGEASSARVGAHRQLADDQAQLPPLQRDLAMARHQLALLVGKAPGAWAAPDFDLAGLIAPAVVPVSLPSELVRRRPDIRAAEADLHAATAEIGVAEAARYPNFSLSARLTQTALQPGDLFSPDFTGWMIGGDVAGSIFNAGSRKADRNAAAAEARASAARYEQTVLSAFAQVADVLTALAHDDDEIRALTAAQTAAESSLKDSRTEWALGGAPFKDIVDAQRELNETRRNLAVAHERRFGDLVQLYAATAADWGKAAH